MQDGNKTEQATPRRRQKAREKGQVPRSRELSGALSLLAVILLLGWQRDFWVGSWRGFFSRILEVGVEGPNGGIQLLTLAGVQSLLLIAPVFFVSWVIAFGTSVAQGGFVFASEALTPNFSRLNPASNLKHLFSVAGLSRLLQSLVPVGFIVFLAVSLGSRELGRMVTASRLGAWPLLSFFSEFLFEFAWKAALVLLVWSVFDYLFQRWHHERSLRMSREEIREEMKDTEGNPMVRSRVRRLRREMRRRWMLKDVERATVVVTNPTEYAVALEYRPEKMAAPVVLAKGRNLLAQKIREIARWSEIPVIENPPLAQALYRAVRVGDAIPASLYAAVAEILAFIYRMQAGMKARVAAAKAAGAGTSS